jgi:hypothetical protein
VRDREASSIKLVNHGRPWHRPTCWAVELAIACEEPTEFCLRLRVPWWVEGAARAYVNGEAAAGTNHMAEMLALERTWHQDTVRLELPYGLHTCPIPDDPERVAFMEGPLVLAGLCDEERTLHLPTDDEGGALDATALLAPADERQWGEWQTVYRVCGQERGLRFIPLYRVVDEPYTVYFPVRRDT